MSYDKMFQEHAKKMWHIQKNGVKFSLKPDLQELSNPLLRMFLNKKAVNYYMLKEDNRVKLFIEESDQFQDWKQNFTAYTVKTCMGGVNRKYHAGFYLTAMTVFNHLNRVINPNDIEFEIYGYSHGAGAATILGSLIRNRSKGYLLDDRVIAFEPPRQAYKPSFGLIRETENDVNYIQGNDIVTKVPWWMQHLGKVRRVDGRDLTGIKRLLNPIFDHDIYWTKDLD